MDMPKYTYTQRHCLEPRPRKFHCEWMWLLCFAFGLSVLLLDHWRPTWCFEPATFLAWCSTSCVLALMSLQMTQANRLLFLIWNVFASHGDCALVLEAHISAEIQYTIYKGFPSWSFLNIKMSKYVLYIHIAQCTGYVYIYINNMYVYIHTYVLCTCFYICRHLSNSLEPQAGDLALCLTSQRYHPKISLRAHQRTANEQQTQYNKKEKTIVDDRLGFLSKPVTEAVVEVSCLFGVLRVCARVCGWFLHVSALSAHSFKGPWHKVHRSHRRFLIRGSVTPLCNRKPTENCLETADSRCCSFLQVSCFLRCLFCSFTCNFPRCSCDPFHAPLSACECLLPLCICNFVIQFRTSGRQKSLMWFSAVYCLSTIYTHVFYIVLNLNKELYKETLKLYVCLLIWVFLCRCMAPKKAVRNQEQNRTM